MAAAPEIPPPLTAEARQWSGVRDMLGDESIQLGHHWSFNIRNDPKRFPFVLSRYKLAAKMASPQLGPKRSVLELGCSEGLGTPLLAEFASGYHGVDLDQGAVATAAANWSAEGVTFATEDFLGRTFPHAGRDTRAFDSVVSLDVIEHIQPDAEPRYWHSVTENLSDTGVAVIGTPNETSDRYASPMSKAGHVNLFTAKRLLATAREHFHQTLFFGLNDEVVHTGFAPLCHYLMVVGFGPKR